MSTNSKKQGHSPKANQAPRGKKEPDKKTSAKGTASQQAEKGAKEQVTNKDKRVTNKDTAITNSDAAEKEDRAAKRNEQRKALTSDLRNEQVEQPDSNESDKTKKKIHTSHGNDIMPM